LHPPAERSFPAHSRPVGWDEGASIDSSRIQSVARVAPLLARHRISLCIRNDKGPALSLLESFMSLNFRSISGTRVLENGGGSIVPRYLAVRTTRTDWASDGQTPEKRRYVS
jgi:hypothetical protein